MFQYSRQQPDGIERIKFLVTNPLCEFGQVETSVDKTLLDIWFLQFDKSTESTRVECPVLDYRTVVVLHVGKCVDAFYYFLLAAATEVDDPCERHVPLIPQIGEVFCFRIGVPRARADEVDLKSNSVHRFVVHLLIDQGRYRLPWAGHLVFAELAIQSDPRVAFYAYQLVVSPIEDDGLHNAFVRLDGGFELLKCGTVLIVLIARGPKSQVELLWRRVVLVHLQKLLDTRIVFVQLNVVDGDV